MRVKWVFVILILSVLLGNLQAKFQKRSPLSLIEYKITMVNPDTREAVIYLSTQSRVTGEVTYKLKSSGSIKLLFEDEAVRKEGASIGQFSTQSWRVILPVEGYILILIEANLSIKEIENQEFVNYQSFPLYVEIQDRRIAKYDLYTPDPKFGYI